MSLFLTFYGDGPYWDNTVVLPAYPSGYSYFRPFRYRDAWVQPALLERMARDPTGFVGEVASLCMRFSTKGSESALVPIRSVTLTSVRAEDDNFVYFKLGPFFRFERGQSLYKCSLNVPEEVDAAADGQEPDRRLFFEADLQVPAGAPEDQDAEMWGRLGELIAGEQSLPIAEKARRALFFHFCTPSRDKPAEVVEIGRSWVAGAKSGARVAERRSYEMCCSTEFPT